jgi:hypothetical protein
MENKTIVEDIAGNKNQNLWTFVVVLILLLFMAIGYKLNNTVSPHYAAEATLDSSCDLRKNTCKLILDDGSSISLEISPNKIPLLERLQVRVEMEGVSASKVEIDFTGVGIDMGYNRPELKAFSKTVFMSDAFLPVCTLTEMDWNAKVLLHTDKGLIMAPFQFHTIRKSTIYDQ